MNTVELAFEVYKKIAYQNIPFSLALKNECRNKKVEGKERSEASTIVGCALRHYLIFDLRIKEENPNLSKDGCALCSIALANSFFLNKINTEDLLLFAKKTLNEDEYKSLENLLLKFKNNGHLIPDSIKPNSVEFLSYRYNTPLWLIKMWNKHYGLNALYKILKSNNRPVENYVKALFNEKIEDENFELVKDETNIYKYVGKESLKRNDLYFNQHLFAYSLGFNEIINKLEIDPVRGIALFTAFPNNIYLDLISRNSKYLKMDIITPTFQVLSDIQRTVKANNLENVKLYEANVSSIITCISNKVQTFFVLPNSSRFSLLRSTPDYFLKIDQNKLDTFIKGERDALDEVAPLIADNGNLIYCIDTISQKEGHLLIEAFLNEHHDFSLLEEKQYLGIGSTSALYYAILTKGSKND